MKQQEPERTLTCQGHFQECITLRFSVEMEMCVGQKKSWSITTVNDTEGLHIQQAEDAISSALHSLLEGLYYKKVFSVLISLLSQTKCKY